jgi:hypothetical protein
MRDQGVYVQLWRKYLPVIRLLLKKTATADQKLQLYKHEFESTGAKNKLGYIFSLDIVNGKAANQTGKTAVAFDLLSVMNDNEAVSSFLKEQSFKISIGKACELHLQKL